MKISGIRRGQRGPRHLPTLARMDHAFMGQVADEARVARLAIGTVPCQGPGLGALLHVGVEDRRNAFTGDSAEPTQARMHVLRGGTPRSMAAYASESSFLPTRAAPALPDPHSAASREAA
ncbi:hypothetical protein ACIPVK_12135 [Paeniglutamicibacter sp. MACA_103]|uniref:hypothetical protein n=1 Tax=Paeniglutamicibacter sp. MACA_103 TaxID=3377337 RepID=UPI00389534B1